MTLICVRAENMLYYIMMMRVEVSCLGAFVLQVTQVNGMNDSDWHLAVGEQWFIHFSGLIDSGPSNQPVNRTNAPTETGPTGAHNMRYAFSSRFLLLFQNHTRTFMLSVWLSEEKKIDPKISTVIIWNAE